MDPNDDKPEGSGKDLRERLEEALKERDSWKTKAIGFEAKDVISTQGFKYVKPEDLAGFEPNELPTKAAELEVVKATEARQVMETALRSRGLDAQQVEDALKSLLGDPEKAAQEQSMSTLAQVTRVAGTPTPHTPQNLYGEDLILAELEAKAAKAARR
jgi:hypothetical protein